ncbi:hypothetical protein PANT_22d00013 [Moesziomyces antarcticus T-34]|uniref:Uncharacterized protein n=1 Tax=Pseudozyma antarctica (strain T-34) TaxID=1151754 RepID=M9MHU7_PSEA3|nr:hypothetical protein PANT_22d00013 [Moesziomyces antarcticus T-34]
MSADRGQDGAADHAPASARPLQTPRFSSFRPLESASIAGPSSSTDKPPSVLSPLVSGASHKADQYRNLKHSSQSSRKSERERERHSDQSSAAGPSFRGESSHTREPKHRDEKRSHHSHRDGDRDSGSSKDKRRRRSRSPRRSSRHSEHRSSARVESDSSSRKLRLDPSHPGESSTFDRDLFFTDTRGDPDALLYGQERSKVPRSRRVPRSVDALGVASRDPPTSERNEPRPNSPDTSSASFPPPSAPDFPLTAEAFIDIKDDSYALGNSYPPPLPGAGIDISERKRRAQAAVDAVPTDINAWLELVRCLPLVSLATTGAPSSSAASSQIPQIAAQAAASIDIQLSVFDRAFEAAPSNHRSVRLHFERLRVLTQADAWQPSAVQAEFVRVLNRFRHTDLSLDTTTEASVVDIWLLYLAWLKSSWSIFQFDRLLDTYKDALDSLRGHLLSAAAAGPASDAVEVLAQGMLAILARLLNILRESGYHEHATALIQTNLHFGSDLDSAITEHTHRVWRPALEPDQRKQEYQRLVEVFREAWERGSIAKSTEAFSGPIPGSDWSNQMATVQDAARGNHFATRWLQAETTRCNHRRAPARLEDLPTWEIEGDEIDPYSTVLFDDLAGFLLPLPSECHARQMLLDVCVEFTKPARSLMSEITSWSSRNCWSNLQLLSDFQGSIGASFWPRTLRRADELESRFIQSANESALTSIRKVLSLLSAKGIHLPSSDTSSSALDDLLDSQALDPALSIPDQRRLWVLRIYLELHPPIATAVDEVEVRKLFERATSTEAGMHCPLLWRLWVDFESRCLDSALSIAQESETAEPKKRGSSKRKAEQKQVTRARSTCLDAIRACPASKGVYLAAFAAPLSRILTQQELVWIFDTIVEKQIRVQVDLVDFIPQDPATGPQEDEDDSDESRNDPFDPTLPYTKRDPRHEQVGGGPSASSDRSRPALEALQAGSAHSCAIDLLQQQAQDRPRSIGLEHLPTELLHHILVLSRSDKFAVASRRLRSICQYASISDRVDYIMARWADRYVAHKIAHPCRAKHKACRRQTSRVIALWREREPAWSDFAATLTVEPCELDALRTAKLDLVTFAAELGICTVQVLERLVNCAAAARIPRALLGAYLRNGSANGALVVHEALERLEVPQPQLPKRLFRHIDDYGFAEPKPVAVIERPKKRRRGRKGDVNDCTEVGQVSTQEPFPAWLTRLLQSLGRDAPHSTNPHTTEQAHADSAASNGLADDKRTHPSDEPDAIKASVGAVPKAAELELILTLLYQYGADASSHSGYPLAMAVHRGSYSLVQLLLLFGADPGCKDGLAVQIAIRNGDLDLLRLLIDGPCLDHDLSNLLPLQPPSAPPQLGSPVYRLDQAHLRLAIQCKHWHVVDFIWHDQNVSPDIACLRLLDKLKP